MLTRRLLNLLVVAGIIFDISSETGVEMQNVMNSCNVSGIGNAVV